MYYRVLTAELQHETNTFSVRLTGPEEFLVAEGQSAIEARRKANTELAGFLDVADSRDWRVDHVLTATAEPAGRVTTEAFETLSTPIIDRITAAAADGRPYDGILLGLHGAMSTADHDDGEGELLRRVRLAVGESVPIAITFDLHANVTDHVCALSDIVISYKTNPHVDLRETGRKAGELLHQTMAGELRPKTLVVRRPMLEEANGGRTDSGPMVERMARCARYEAEHDDVLDVSINSGMAWADLEVMGPTVTLVYDGNAEAHQAFADSIADDIWNRRFERIETFVAPKKAAAEAVRHDGQQGPLIINDYADNPGGGAYGDATSLLKALLEAEVTNTCFGGLVDPEAVESLRDKQVGDTVTLAIGGKTDPGSAVSPCPSPATYSCYQMANSLRQER